MLFVGPHVSIAKDISLAPIRAHELGATGFALFTKNQRVWSAPPISEESIISFRKNMEEALAAINDGTLPLTAYRPEGSFLLYVDCHNAGIGTKHLDRFFLENAHIHLDDGLDNFGPEGEGYIRINFAVTNKVLKDALGRIRKAFQNR